MSSFLFSIVTQTISFVPLAFGISISYHILRATDMTIDGSFVLGAVIFARSVTAGLSPTTALVLSLAGGALAGVLSATIQRGGRVDSLLAGVLATFILSSLNLIILGQPNINLLSQPGLFSFAFDKNILFSWIIVAAYATAFCGMIFLFLTTRMGLILRAFGDNPLLLQRLGKPIEGYRVIGFALSNLLAASSGCLTAQIVGYADIGMGLGMTLTGIGAIILGQQVFMRLKKQNYCRLGSEFLICLIGVLIYFFSLNGLLRLEIDPLYLKMFLGLLLILFLRAAVKNKSGSNV